MDEYKSSLKSKKETVQPEVIPHLEVAKDAGVKKSSGLSSLAHNFIKGDFKDIREHLWYDVIIPKSRDLIVTGLKDGIDILFYGKPRGNSGGGGSINVGDGSSRIAYSSIYRSNSQGANTTPTTTRISRDLSDYTWPTQAKAEEALLTLKQALNEYGKLYVGHFYEVAGVEGDFTSWKYGWRDISSARVESTWSGGEWRWRIIMPQITPLS